MKAKSFFQKGFRILPDWFPNTSGEVSEYFREGFRIVTEKFPNLNRKVSNSFGIDRDSDVFSHFRSKDTGNVLETLVEV